MQHLSDEIASVLIARLVQTAEILGPGFSGTTSVLFNGSPATFKAQSDVTFYSRAYTPIHP